MQQSLVIILSIFVVLIPFYFLLSVIIGEIQQLLIDRESIITSIQAGGHFFTHYLARLNIPLDTFQTKIEETAMDIASETVNYTSKFILGSIQSLSQQSIGLSANVFFALLSFNGEDSALRTKVYVAVPFNEENTATLLDEFRRIVRTTLIASGAVALVPGWNSDHRLSSYLISRELFSGVPLQQSCPFCLLSEHL